MDFVISIIACCEIGFLNLISMGFLRVHFEGGGGSKSTKALLMLLMSAFLQKISVFWQK